MFGPSLEPVESRVVGEKDEFCTGLWYGLDVGQILYIYIYSDGQPILQIPHCHIHAFSLNKEGLHCYMGLTIFSIIFSNISYIQMDVGNSKEYFVECCQSHKTLLWI